MGSSPPESPFLGQYLSSQAAALGLMGAVEVLNAGASALRTAVLYDNFGAAWISAASGLFGFMIVMLGALRFRGTDSEPADTTR